MASNPDTDSLCFNCTKFGDCKYATPRKRTCNHFKSNFFDDDV